MPSQKKPLNKIIIFVLAGLIVFQAVSIGILLLKNMHLEKAIAKKRTAKAAFYKKVPVPVRATGRVAIVLDDWGYNKKNVQALLEISQPVTVAVLPNLPFSKIVAVNANANNIEVILHLPLEAHDSNKRPEKGVIKTDMSTKEVLERLQSALDSVPYVKGVSNHMGSKATEDEKLMKLLFVQFKKKNLYFLDSLVTTSSICGKTAAEAGIKFTERSVFLDNENRPEYIAAQLRQAIALAKEKSAVVAIGHDRALTIKTIKNILPEFQREGVKLVYLSEVVK